MFIWSAHWQVKDLDNITRPLFTTLLTRVLRFCCVFAHERFEVGYLPSFHKWGSNQVSSFPPGVSKDEKRKTKIIYRLCWNESCNDCPLKMAQKSCPCLSPYITSYIVFIIKTKGHTVRQTQSRNRVLCCWLEVLPAAAFIRAETMQQVSTPLTHYSRVERSAGKQGMESCLMS